MSLKNQRYGFLTLVLITIMMPHMVVSPSENRCVRPLHQTGAAHSAGLVRHMMTWTVWLGPLHGEDVMGSVRDQLYNRVECRVGLVGDRGVGKTTLAIKFCGEEFMKVNLNFG